MQGVKKYKPKLFTNFFLPDFPPVVGQVSRMTIWNVYYRNVHLGYFEESKFGRREQYQPYWTAKAGFQPNLSVNYVPRCSVNHLPNNTNLGAYRNTIRLGQFSLHF